MKMILFYIYYNNIISKKNSIVVNYKNSLNSSKSILNEIEKYKFVKDLKFMKFLEKKKNEK